MPQKRKVKTLKRSCFHSITKDIDSYWCKDYLDNYQEDGIKCLHVVGPFDDLPAGIKHELVMYLAEVSKLKRAHLELLLDESTTQIDFSFPGIAPLLKDSQLNLICIRCKNLTVLNMDWCRKVTPKMLLDAFPNFTKLKALKMDGTKCNDRVLHVLGHYCPKLVELHISHCNDVTDQGIRNLLLNSSGTVQCAEITKLYMEATSVSAEGVQVALEYLPKLQILQSDFLLETLANLHGSEFDSSGEIANSKKTYGLTQLGAQSSIESMSSDHPEQLSRYISIATAHCPNVSEVTLFAYANDKCLITLSLLEHLKCLSLLDCFEHVTFDNGVLPFLQIRGKDLHTLRLDVTEIDIKVIGFFCPNIRKLDLEFLSNYISDLIKVKITEDTVLFSNLIWLRVACESVSLDNLSLKLLLSHCQNINYLLLRSVNDMTDEVLSEIYESNPLNNLETIVFKHCDSVTAKSVWPLLRTYNELRILHLDNCKHITRQDSEQIRKHLRKYKDPLDFAWY